MLTAALIVTNDLPLSRERRHGHFTLPEKPKPLVG
jgi:hypothetical protein